MKVSVSLVKDFGVGEMVGVWVMVGVLCRVAVGSMNRITLGGAVANPGAASRDRDPKRTPGESRNTAGAGA